MTAPTLALGGLGLETWFSVQGFLVYEAELLDGGRFPEWLDLFTDDAVYRAPVRVTRRRGNADTDEDMFLYDENRASLGLRVKRLGTDVAWAEDPPSFTRRFVTNLRVRPGEDNGNDGADGADGAVLARSYLMLYRSRGDRGHYDVISAERHDLLRPAEDGWRIARRTILIDQAVLATKNLGVFL